MVQSSHPKALMILRESSRREVTPRATRQKVQNITINAGPRSDESESLMLNQVNRQHEGRGKRYSAIKCLPAVLVDLVTY